MSGHGFKRWHSSMIVVGLLLSACQASVEAPSSEADSSQTSDSSLSTSEEGKEVQIELEVGPGSFFLTDKTAGHAKLSSYVATLNVSFEGTEAGQATNWSRTYAMVYAQEPLTRVMTITNAGDLPSANPSLLAQLDERSYQVNNEGACTVSDFDQETDGDPSQTDRMEPAFFLHSVLGAEEAGQETINEVPAEHYTFDQRALVEPKISEASGEVWIASEGGQILRYLLSVTANEDYFGEGIEGVITWDYELTEINQAPPPVLPDSCQINAPLLADAANVLNLPYWLAFDTAFSVADASAFYQEQLPALGWIAQPEPSFYDTGALLEFAQGDQILTVSITAGDGPMTRVNIVRREAEE